LTGFKCCIAQAYIAIAPAAEAFIDLVEPYER
jgi:hypothetical protein